MNQKLILSLELLNSKLGYVFACLSPYVSLHLSKGISEINQHVYLIKKSIIDNKEYVDIRNVIKLREQLKQLRTRLTDEKEVALTGHKIACLLFEVSVLTKMVILEMDKANQDMIEYLSLVGEYLYTCGRIVNIEMLCFEEKID